ncbi:SIMPL domain-containing protein [bacterium]|nr:SIMPL domain-containing protein [bacterium]
MFKKVLVLAVVSGLMVSSSFAANEVQQERGYISLRGTASREVTPNVAEISFTVENFNKDAKTAIAENNKTATAVVNAIKSKLNKDKDIIKTGRISVTPNYNYSKDGKKSLKDYTVVNSVTIRTEQVESISQIVDAALSNGANRMNGLNFMFTEDKKVCDELYPEIVKNLRNQATVLSSGFGSTLAGIKYLSASCGKQYSTMYRSNAVMAKAYMADGAAEETVSTPIEAGKVKIDANVEVQIFVK